MSLSSELVSQFVKVTKDEVEEKQETTVYGTIVEHENRKYVKLDGSDLLTPISSTAEAEVGERVTVMIKNHTAVVTGNISSPSARTESVQQIGNRITEAEILIADKVSTKEFDAANGRIDNLVSDNVTIKEQLTANNASIKNLEADNVTINGKLEATDAEIEKLDAKIITVEVMDAKYATIENLNSTNIEVNNLKGTYGDFEVLVTEKLEATDAEFENLNTKYATIDFANIGSAAMEYFYAQSGLIDDVVVGDASITGRLVGVTIRGDLIEGNTIVADKLVIKGEDGIYYKLNTDGIKTEAEQTDYNSINGSIITAKSITATKVNVDDLVAFDATIGGFKITDNSIHSINKESIDSPNQGIYLDNSAQVYIGDDTNFIKYYRDEEGNYKLAISAESILFGSSSKSSAADLKALTEHVHINTYKDPETGNEQPCVELSEGDSDFKMRLTNTAATFMDGSSERTTVDKDGIGTENVSVRSELKQTNPQIDGEFIWSVRANGNYGLTWREVSR